MSKPAQFDKKSINAVIATINARSDTQDTQLAEIKDQAIKTNGRLRRLELWRAYILGALAVIVGLAGWIVLLFSSLK